MLPVTLELGGKSSAIVMEDADLDDISAKLIRSCMRNTGQTCYISTRILAPAFRYDEVVDMVTETISAAPQREPLDPATVFGPSANVSPEIRVAREEIFGPVITILKYAAIDEAISLANNTEYGLGGIVFASDQNEALEVAEAMNTGNVGINFFTSNHAASFGGRNDSGLGVEYGPEGLVAYLSYTSIHRY